YCHRHHLSLLSFPTRRSSDLFSLLLNFIVILITILLMTDESANPIILTLIASVAISTINLLFINKVNSKTVIAFIATMITISLLVILIYFVTKKTMIQG